MRNPPNPSSFSGKDITRLRRLAELDPDELADMLGVDESTIIAWEKGEGSPDKDLNTLLQTLKDSLGN